MLFAGMRLIYFEVFDIDLFGEMRYVQGGDEAVLEFDAAPRRVAIKEQRK